MVVGCHHFRKPPTYPCKSNQINLELAKISRRLRLRPPRWGHQKWLNLEMLGFRIAAGRIPDIFWCLGLDGGFKYFLFLQLPGEMIQFDGRIFFKWVEWNHQLVVSWFLLPSLNHSRIHQQIFSTWQLFFQPTFWRVALNHCRRGYSLAYITATSRSEVRGWTR